MKKELKEQIKHDEFREGIGHAASFVSTHRDEARVTLLAVAVLALAAVGFASYRSHRQASAERAFDEALTTFHAPVVGEPDAAQAGGTVYPSAAEKYQKAATEFAEIARRHGSTNAGRRARYYAALANLELGKAAEAQKELTELAGDGGDTLVRDLARLALADLHHAQGRATEAVEGYRRLVDDRDSTVPRDHALMRLAATLEEGKQIPDAVAAYRRLSEEFPASVYAAEARRKVEYHGGPAAGRS
jgi:TolA-binding protein